jgi:orotate phosphoribosyltransferase
MVQHIPPGTEVLAGLEMGGIPIVTMLSQTSGIPAAFVRKKAKQYGTCRFAEGAEIENKRVCIVEDVVTFGGQIILSASDLRSGRAHVDTVLCVVDRESGAKKKLKSEGLELRPLLAKTELEDSIETRTIGWCGTAGERGPTTKPFETTSSPYIKLIDNIYQFGILDIP